MIDELPARIRNKIAVDASGCWLWTASLSPGGYGRIKWPGTQMAHRVTYTLLVGPIPDGLHVDHLCRVRRCVNPDHLEPVTQGENNRRSDSPTMREWRIRQETGRCSRGHDVTAPGSFWVRSANGRRICRECSSALNREFRARRRLGQTAGVA